MKSTLPTVLAAALLLALMFAPQADAQQVPPAATPQTEQLGVWLARAARAYDTEDHQAWVEALENLHRMRPHNPDFMYQLVTGYALTDQLEKAFDMMLRMQQQGLSYDWDENPDVESLRKHSLYDHLNNLMKEAGQPFGDARRVAGLAEDISMPEALAHDAATGRLFVGTVRDGRILVRPADDDGVDWKPFASPETVEGLHAVFDLIADSERGHLWVATGMTSQYRDYKQSEFGRSRLIKLDLASGEKLAEYKVPADGHPHLLGAMTQGPDGAIYAADSLAPVIYRLRPDADRPERFARHPIFTGLRGLAISADGKNLYVADYELGLFVIQGDESPNIFALGIPRQLNVAGIDGVYWWEDSLITIQNGVSPQRVQRLELDESGTRVTAVHPLVAAHPQFDTPTFGTLKGDELVFLGASHWDKVDGRGRPVSGKLPEIPVLATRVDSTRTMVVGENVLEQLRRQGRLIDPGEQPGAAESKEDGG